MEATHCMAGRAAVVECPPARPALAGRHGSVEATGELGYMALPAAQRVTALPLAAAAVRAAKAQGQPLAVMGRVAN